MQIKGLHKNIYRLYAYARTQECLEVYRQKYLHQVQRWEKLGSQGVSIELRQEITHARNIAWNCPGSNALKKRRNVSSLGMPLLKAKNWRRKSIFA